MRPCNTFDRGLSLLAHQNTEMNTHDPEAVQAALQVSALLILEYIQLCSHAILQSPSARKSYIRIHIVLLRVLMLRRHVPKSKLFKLSLAPVVEWQFLQARQAWVPPLMLLPRHS